MAKYLIAVLALAASALADNTAYDAGGYAASSAYSRQADAYAPPGDTYGTPDPYDPAPTYDDNSYAPQDSYEATADCRTTGTCADDLFDLAKITELLPLFLAVFAAMIVAQLFAPLLSMLVGAKVGLASGLLAPLSGILTGVINTILATFNLAICDISGAAPVVKPGKRSFGGLEGDMVDALSHLVLNSISAYEQ